MAWQLRPAVPVWEAFVAWSVAGFGMGLSYAPLSLMMMRAAPPGREGWASASLNLADVLGIALGVGIGGAAVAAVSRGSRPIAAWCGHCLRRSRAGGRPGAGRRTPPAGVARAHPGATRHSIEPRNPRNQSSAACQAASAWRRCSAPCSPAVGYEPRNLTPARPA